LTHSVLLLLLLLLLTYALVPVEVLYKSNGTVTAESSRQVDTAVLTDLIVRTLVSVLT